MATVQPFRWIVGLRGLVLLAGTTALYSQPYRPMMFVGGSMEPTYRNGEFALTVRSLGELKRGDIVVVQRPEGPIVKRVAYVPGDQILQVHGGGGWTTVLFAARLLRHKESSNMRLVTVPEGEVFVIGDNVGQSSDSRDFGAVPVSTIRAKIVSPRKPGKEWSRLVTVDAPTKTW